MPFDGLRVLSFESRRSREIERLIRAHGGEAFVAPSMREVPLEHNVEALEFAERLFRGELDMMIFLTGVGARLLAQIVETRRPPTAFPEALRKIAVVARGSKPSAVMREWAVPVAVQVPEPNTWREILASVKHRSERRIAVQEYGRPSTELIEGLRAFGAEVTPVPVYQWDLPEDLGPLEEAAQRLSDGRFDVVIFTTSVQAIHLLRICGADPLVRRRPPGRLPCDLHADATRGSRADQGVRPPFEHAVRDALRRVVVASVGPTTTETLTELGIAVDFEPSHPKMGYLVSELSANAARILQTKR